MSDASAHALLCAWGDRVGQEESRDWRRGNEGGGGRGRRGGGGEQWRCVMQETKGCQKQAEMIGRARTLEEEEQGARH
eukprot:1289865-Rhodomonas_salina.1